MFFSEFKRCYDNSFPHKHARTQKGALRKPWMTYTLHRRIRERNKMHRAFVVCRSPDLFAEYKVRSKLNSDLQKAKDNYYINLFAHCQTNTKRVWQSANEIAGRNTSPVYLQELVVNDCVITGKALVDTVNVYFVNAGKHDSGDTDSELSMKALNSLTNTTFFEAVTTPETELLLSELANDVSAGYDEMKAEPVKYVAGIIAPTLTYVMNLMFEKGSFPDCLNTARVVPTYKGGNKNQLTNYTR